MSIFIEGGVRPQSSKKFLQRLYSVASATASAVEQRLYTAIRGSTQQLQQRQVPKPLPTADHLRNAGTLPVTASKSERVFSKLQRTLTSIRSTMTED